MWPRVVGYISSTSCFIAAVPRNKSNCVPGGSKPDKVKEWYHMMNKETCTANTDLTKRDMSYVTMIMIEVSDNHIEEPVYK